MAGSDRHEACASRCSATSDPPLGRASRAASSRGTGQRQVAAVGEAARRARAELAVGSRRSRAGEVVGGASGRRSSSRRATLRPRWRASASSSSATLAALDGARHRRPRRDDELGELELRESRLVGAERRQRRSVGIVALTRTASARLGDGRASAPSAEHGRCGTSAFADAQERPRRDPRVRARRRPADARPRRRVTASRPDGTFEQPHRRAARRLGWWLIADGAQPSRVRGRVRTVLARDRLDERQMNRRSRRASKVTRVL